MESMKRILLFAALSIFMVSTAFADNPFKKKPPVEWQTDLRVAHKIAVQQNKPMLVVFGADWCTYCKKLEKQTLYVPEMANYINSSFIPVHLDADKDKRVMEILKIEGLPCSVVLSPKADLLGKIKGYHKPGSYYQKLAEAKLVHTQGVQQTSGQ